MAYKGTAIQGTAAGQLAQMEGVVRRINPHAPDVAGLYLSTGPHLGVRGDLAYAQAIHETDYFRFTGVVKPEQNNYGGIGATGPDNPGASFATPAEGVLAHLQHLYAYASTGPLPDGMPKVDPRFDLVPRGSGPAIGDLNGRWAVPGTTYGQSIDRVLGEILTEPASGEPYQITKAYLDPNSQNRPGPCTASGCWQGMAGIVVHRTASPSMDAWAIRRYFNDAPDGRFASSQFTLDNNVILQLMPVGEIAYQTAGKNFTTVGIETCEHNWGTDAFAETYRKLVWLVAHLMRLFKLDIAAVSGHFWWDPVNRPYDPTHMGWTPADGKATGVFDWNTFITDVNQLATAPQSVDVRIVRVINDHCTDGVLIGDTTYVPVRAYTTCVRPDANIRWEEDGPRVIVELP
ncbi:MAG: N-acetylmuramoyl-L-alanine amidase-like protein [Firmicutes bacterium]|nr:N-acetylmuramoyl-L-alanine amidase-like protein [Bacillota bacterium]